MCARHWSVVTQAFFNALLRITSPRRRDGPDVIRDASRPGRSEPHGGKTGSERLAPQRIAATTRTGARGSSWKAKPGALRAALQSSSRSPAVSSDAGHLLASQRAVLRALCTARDAVSRSIEYAASTSRLVPALPVPWSGLRASRRGDPRATLLTNQGLLVLVKWSRGGSNPPLWHRAREFPRKTSGPRARTVRNRVGRAISRAIFLEPSGVGRRCSRVRRCGL